MPIVHAHQYHSDMPQSLRTIGYAPLGGKEKARKAAWVVALSVLGAIALVETLPLGANLFTSIKYAGVKPGMKRADVDRHLWEFARRTNVAYSGIGPGQCVVRYELLWFGKWAGIQVIYNADSTVFDPQPIFDD